MTICKFGRAVAGSKKAKIGRVGLEPDPFYSAEQLNIGVF